jgi:hypothetical protein
VARDYTMNPQAAKESSSGGKRIDQHGVYRGTFRAAFYEVNERGTESVNLIFVTDDGKECGPLAIYTHNGSGQELPGFKTFNAILACMKLRGIKAQPGKVRLWDAASNAEVEKAKDCYPAMVGPRIGLVLTEEEYVNRNGDKRTRIVISAPFNAETGQMADEVLSSQNNGVLDKYTAWLTAKDRWVKPLKNSEPPAQSGGFRGYSDAPASSSFPDDDIPF